MLSSQQLFENYKLQTTKSKKTERGELIKYFADKMNYSMPRAGDCLSIYNDDLLYALKQKCDGAKNFQACFNWHLYPKFDNDLPY